MATPPMQSPEQALPRDVLISESLQPTTSGTFEKHTFVRFYVGKHGPFTLEYGPGAYSVERARGDIAAKASEVQATIQGMY